MTQVHKNLKIAVYDSRNRQADRNLIASHRSINYKADCPLGYLSQIEQSEKELQCAVSGHINTNHRHVTRNMFTFP